MEERANRDLRRCNALQVAEYASSLRGAQEVHLNVDHVTGVRHTVNQELVVQFT